MRRKSEEIIYMLLFIISITIFFLVLLFSCVLSVDSTSIEKLKFHFNLKWQRDSPLKSKVSWKIDFHRRTLHFTYSFIAIVAVPCLIFDSTKLQTKQKKISILFPISDNLVQSRFFSFSREKSCILLKWWKIHKCFSFILKYKFIYSLFPVQYETRFFRFFGFFHIKIFTRSYSRECLAVVVVVACK